MPHFDLAEYRARQAKTRAAIEEAGLDAMLFFAPESHYWLTGYDTFGFAMFQCMVMTARGNIQLLTRMPDLRQAQHTSVLENDQIHVWPEYEGSNPTDHLIALLGSPRRHWDVSPIHQDLRITTVNFCGLHSPGSRITQSFAASCAG